MYLGANFRTLLVQEKVAWEQSQRIIEPGLELSVPQSSVPLNLCFLKRVIVMFRGILRLVSWRSSQLGKIWFENSWDWLQRIKVILSFSRNFANDGNLFYYIGNKTFFGDYMDYSYGQYQIKLIPLRLQLRCRFTYLTFWRWLKLLGN